MLFCLFVVTLFGGSLCDPAAVGKAPRIPLNDGNFIPHLGLGTFLGFDMNGQKAVGEGEIEVPVSWALDAGYRLIDTAAAYHNEEQVGKAIQKSIVPREDIFVVTKLSSYTQREVVKSLRDSLEKLNLTYVDLFLIHNPVTFKADGSFDVVDYVDTWAGMEEAHRLGLAKSIGISNFNISQMERLFDNSKIKPAVLQVEVNLNLAQNKVLDFCKAHNLVVMAYTPFGSMFTKEDDSPPPKVDDHTLVTIGKKYGKTVPQVALRYLVQRGVVPIPKSVHKNRIEENIDVFDFDLTNEEMDTLSKFNRDYRTVSPSFWQDHPYYPFEKEDSPKPDLFKRPSTQN